MVAEAREAVGERSALESGYVAPNGGTVGACESRQPYGAADEAAEEEQQGRGAGCEVQCRGTRLDRDAHHKDPPAHTQRSERRECSAGDATEEGRGPQVHGCAVG